MMHDVVLRGVQLADGGYVEVVESNGIYWVIRYNELDLESFYFETLSDAVMKSQEIVEIAERYNILK